MSSKKTALAIAIVVAAVIASAYAHGRGGRGDESREEQSRGLGGTWKVTFSFTEPPGFPNVDVLFTFIPGEKKTEGTLIDTNSLQLTPNPVCTPDQGVWERVGEDSYIATHYDFCFDETSNPPGNFAGTSKIRDRITLSRDGLTINVHQYIEGFDPSGTLVFVSVGDGQGTRVRAEAPPES